MPVQPLPNCGSGAGTDAVDVEQTLLCDVLPDGEIAGTALAVYEYDAEGNPAGAPTFVDPATGDAYVAQGILQPCPGDVGCGAPVQFCFQSTAPIDQPGRMYDTVLTLAQGFAVQGIVSDLVDTPVNVLWEVTDPDGTAFAANLQTAIQSQFPGQTVSVTPGAVDPCSGGTADFAIHVECLRLDQDPPALLQLRYNAGRDLIINPGYLATPPQSQFAFLKRQDSTSPVAVADVLCTNVANRGWETNDKSNSFETWGPPGSTQNIFEGTTPTPRGTVVQEINSFGSGPTPTTGANAGNPAYGINPDTIWQTFTVPAAGNFTIRVVVGGRATTENIPIKLSTGDVGDTGIGDIINTSVNAPKVTTENATSAGAWTTFNQVVPLSAGTYTLAFTGPENQTSATDDNAFGGLFTDMRVFQDAPNTIQNFVNDDDTCVVPTSVTSTICEFWAPRCAGGNIVGWYNVADGEELTNAQFWAQVPAPTCCSGTSNGGQSSTGNLVYTYLACATLNGERRTMSRVVVSDQSGGIIADTFVDTDGAPVTPDTWQPGDCSGASPTVGEFILCDLGTPTPTPFLRTYTETVTGVVTGHQDYTLDGAPYAEIGPVGTCPTVDTEVLTLCDDGPAVPLPFLRRIVFNAEEVSAIVDTDLDGAPYVLTGEAVVCGAVEAAGRDEELLVLCDATPTRFLRRYNYDSTTGALVSIVNTTLDGSTPFAPVGAVGVCTTAIASDFDFLSTVLCDANGTQFIQRLTFNSATGAVTATTNTTLTGAAFAPVAPVALCSSCCPVVVGEGCTNVGSLRYTALRLANGTISLIDSVTGAAVLQANIVVCAPANGVLPNVAADHFEAVPGTPWTPAVVPAGRRLVSLTYTVLTGTATVVDATGGTSIATIPAGYSATWTAQDDRETLTPPASITSVGGRVIVLMLTAA